MSTIADYSPSQLLALVTALPSQPLPTLLETLVDLCSTQSSLFQTFIQSIQTATQKQSQKHLCLVVSKALRQSSWSESYKLQCYLRLSVNFSISFQTKKVFERDLKQFIVASELDVQSYFEAVIHQLQNLIEAAASGKPGNYQSQSFKLGQSAFALSVSIPDQLDEMMLTYIFLLRTMLLDINPQSFIERIESINCFYYLEMVHLMIFSAERINNNPAMFSSLFAFYLDFQEIIALTNENSIANIMNDWLELSQQLRLIYQAACTPPLEDAIDYLQIKQYPNRKEFTLLKQLASEFHNNLLYQKSKTEIVLQLEILVPSIISTIQHFSNQIDVDHYQTQFVANLVYMLSLYIEQAKIIKIKPIWLFTEVVLSLAECAINLLSQTNVSGSQIQIELDKCCDITQSQTILANTVKLIEKIFQRYEEVLAKFYEWVIDTFKIDSSLTGEVEQSPQIPPKLMFLILNIVSWDKNQTFQSVCSLLKSIIDLQFIEHLLLDDLIYFYYFLSNNWKSIYPQDPIHCQIIVSYVLNNTHQQNSFLYIGLSFLHSLFQQFCNEQWLKSFVARIPSIKEPQCIESKWNVFRTVMFKRFDTFESETICNIIQHMKKSAEKEIERMLIQKQEDIEVSFGETPHYLTCFNYLLKKDSKHNSVIIKQLLDYCRLFQFASQAGMQGNLIDLISELLQLYPQYANLRNDYAAILKQLICLIEARFFDGKHLFETLLKFINAMNEEKEIVQIEPIIGLINRAIYHLTNNIRSYRDLNTLNYYVILLQKYLIFFGSIIGPEFWSPSYHKCLSFLQKLPPISQDADEGRAMHNLKAQLSKNITKSRIPIKTAARIYILQLISCISRNHQIPWKQLQQQTRQFAFLDYQAFLLLHIFSCIINTQTHYHQSLIIDIAMSILVCQLTVEAQRYNLSLQRSLCSNVRKQNPKDTLSFMHQTLQKKYYQPSITQQTQQLIQQYSKQGKCISQHYIEYLKFTQVLPLLISESERKKYYAELQQRNHKMRGCSFQATMLFESAPLRRFVKVAGDKLQSPLSLINLFEKMSFKRESNYFLGYNEAHKKWHAQNNLQISWLDQLQSQVDSSDEEGHISTTNHLQSINLTRDEDR